MATELFSDRNTIGKWLVEQGTLSAEQVRQLLTLQRRDARAGVRSRLGELAVRAGWADPSAVNAGLHRQTAAILDHVGLSDILLALGFVTPKALDRALAADDSRPLADVLLQQGSCMPDQLQAAMQVLSLRHGSALRAIADSSFVPVNAMEILVAEQIDEALAADDGCRCVECWSAVFAAAVGLLPPRYVSRYAHLPEAVRRYRQEYDDLIRRKLADAVAAVRSDPKAACRSRFSDDVLREGGFEGRVVPVVAHISNRHLHLSKEHIEALFGPGYELRKQKDLMQPGQYAAEETVTLVGPRASIENVRVLGPARKQTQVEISGTDQFTLGLRAPVRESGQLEGTPGVRLRGPAGEVELETGVIRALRHVHMLPEDAARMGLRNGDRVAVRLAGDRATVAEGVLIRATATSALEMHVDTDEANAAGLPAESTAEILVPAAG